MTEPAGHGFLVVEDLVVLRGGRPAVEGVSLDFGRCGITALVGPSGCGKTSLLRAMAGFERPAAGRVLVDGVEVVGPSCWVEPEHRCLGMVFQQGALFPHLTVRDNVRYGLRGRGDRDRTAAQALELVGVSSLGDRYPDQLSGGQQQRVALARALAPSPKAILLDEPFANLDAALRVRLREDVRAILQAAGVTAILVTHDQEEALSVADQLAVMDRGRILQVGTAEEVYQRPASIRVAEFIGGGQLLECPIAAGRVDSPFGPLATKAPDGDGALLVRPEDLTVVLAGAPSSVRGEIVRRSFFAAARTASPM